jgi:hypothetical protein
VHGLLHYKNSLGFLRIFLEQCLGIMRRLTEFIDEQFCSFVMEHLPVKVA